MSVLTIVAGIGRDNGGTKSHKCNESLHFGNETKIKIRLIYKRHIPPPTVLLWHWDLTSPVRLRNAEGAVLPMATFKRRHILQWNLTRKRRIFRPVYAFGRIATASRSRTHIERGHKIGYDSAIKLVQSMVILT